MKKIVSIWEKKVYFYFSKIESVQVRKTPETDDGIEYPPYMVIINGSEQALLYDGKFYIQVNNRELQMEELAKHEEEINGYKEEWKTEEEIDEIMAWKGTDYIDRVEYIIDSEEVTSTVKRAIELL